MERLKSDMLALLRERRLYHASVNETFHEQSGGFGARPLDDVIKMVKAHFAPLSDRQILQLYKYYSEDFEAFGYTFDMQTRRVGGF